MIRHRGRVSGPLLDRVDMHLTVPGVSLDELTGVQRGEQSRTVRKRVVRVRRLQRFVDRMGLSARGYHRILTVARTIADLAGADDIGAAHVQEAIHYRTLDRTSF